jgi:hypothetical protein
MTKNRIIRTLLLLAIILVAWPLEAGRYLLFCGLVIALTYTEE